MTVSRERQKEFLARTLVGMVLYNKREFTDEECKVYNSILALIDEKAEQIKAGAVGPRFPVGVHDVDEDPSPGLSDADERALKVVEHYTNTGYATGPGKPPDLRKALAHLRSRLAKPAPCGDVMCEICGAIGHLRPAPIVDSSADIPKPAPPVNCPACSGKGTVYSDPDRRQLICGDCEGTGFNKETMHES